MRRLIATAIAFCCAALLAAAPSKPAQGLVLEYVSGKQLTASPDSGKKLSLGAGLSIGDSIAPGSTIATGSGTNAELKLVPNGSILKLTPNTVFKFVSLATQAKPVNAFALASGKVRALAAKTSAQSYSFSTQNSVLAVRGTDFILAVSPGKSAKVLVRQGKVGYAKLDSRGKVVEEVEVDEGEEVDAYDEDFDVETYDEAEFEEYFEDAEFEGLDDEYADLYDDGEVDLPQDEEFDPENGTDDGTDDEESEDEGED